MEDVAELITEKNTGQDADGNALTKRYKRDVFCKVRSVTRNEFYRAAEQDLHPDIVITISDRIDYNDEKLVAYDQKLYDVIRTEWSGDEVELTLTERVGEKYTLYPALVMPDGKILVMPDGMEETDVGS